MPCSVMEQLSKQRNEKESKEATLLSLTAMELRDLLRLRVKSITRLDKVSGLLVKLLWHSNRKNLLTQSTLARHASTRRRQSRPSYLKLWLMTTAKSQLVWETNSPSPTSTLEPRPIRRLWWRLLRLTKRPTQMQAGSAEHHQFKLRWQTQLSLVLLCVQLTSKWDQSCLSIITTKLLASVRLIRVQVQLVWPKIPAISNLSRNRISPRLSLQATTSPKVMAHSRQSIKNSPIGSSPKWPNDQIRSNNLWASVMVLFKSRFKTTHSNQLLSQLINFVANQFK